jgi:MFS family permease
MMWMMVLTGGSAGLNVASVYKSFAATSVALSGDGYLSLVGGIGAILNGLGRLFWGIVSDKYGFKNSWIVLAMLQSILGFMYPFSADSKIGFLVATACSYFFLAGAFALIPSACQKVFGPANGTTIYGIVMTAFGFAAVGGNIFTMVSSCEISALSYGYAVSSTSFLSFRISFSALNYLPSPPLPILTNSHTFSQYCL